MDRNKNKAYYVYNSSGERVRKVIEKGRIREERLYLGGYEVYRKYNVDVVELERTSLFVSDGNKTITQIDNDGHTKTTRYQYDNQLGSASLELDERANIISYEEYHPFGTTSYRSGRSEAEVSLKRYKYVGKERDNETGFYYYGARYYSGWLGRFVSVDPLQAKFPNYSPYAYGNDNPIRYIDPNGEAPKSPDWWINNETKEVKEFENKKLWDQPEMEEKGYSYLGEYRTDLGGILDEPIYFNTIELFNRDQDLWVAGHNLGGRWGSLSGEQGLEKLSNGMSYVGIGLQLTPISPVGDLLLAGSSIIDTGLDFKNKSNKEALGRTGIRFLLFIGVQGVTKGANMVREKYFIKAIPEIGRRVTNFSINAEMSIIEKALLETTSVSDKTSYEREEVIIPKLNDSNHIELKEINVDENDIFNNDDKSNN